MTTILAIETSTELASAALLTDGRYLVRELSGTQTHSQGILPAIQSLLAEAGIVLKQCDAIAFGCGPGAFTGIRTACGIVQGLAVGADLPVIPVTSLEAMALGAYQQTGCAQIACILDARMNEIYWAQYHLTDDACQVVCPPALVAINSVTVQAADPLTLAVGNGVLLPPELSAFTVFPCMPHAREIAQAGMRAFRSGAVFGPEQAQPLYLRNKIALTTAEREQARLSA